MKMLGSQGMYSFIHSTNIYWALTTCQTLKTDPGMWLGVKHGGLWSLEQGGECLRSGDKRIWSDVRRKVSLEEVFLAAVWRSWDSGMLRIDTAEWFGSEKKTTCTHL